VMPPLLRSLHRDAWISSSSFTSRFDMV
jgi:hypothetical protein